MTAVHRVVADVDTGIDDALALVWLAGEHRAGRIDLHVTTSAGNTTSTLAARNSREVLRVAGASDVPVAAGASSPRVLPLTTTPETHGAEGLGYWRPREDARPASPPSEEAAVEGWRRAGPSHLLVAGPATNLAHAIEHAPEVLAGVQVTLMGGAFTYPGNTTPTAEWNTWVDPHALSYALSHWPADTPPPVICPLNVTERVILTPERLAAWTDGSELSALLQDALRFYFEFHESVGVGYCAQIHDLAAAMVLLDAVPFETSPATVQVETASELLRGTTVADWVTGAEAVGPYWNLPANAKILTGLYPEDVFAQFATCTRR